MDFSLCALVAASFAGHATAARDVTSRTSQPAGDGRHSLNAHESLYYSPEYRTASKEPAVISSVQGSPLKVPLFLAACTLSVFDTVRAGHRRLLRGR